MFESSQSSTEVKQNTKRKSKKQPKQQRIQICIFLNITADIQVHKYIQLNIDYI